MERKKVVVEVDRSGAVRIQIGDALKRSATLARSLNTNWFESVRRGGNTTARALNGIRLSASVLMPSRTVQIRGSRFESGHRFWPIGGQVQLGWSRLGERIPGQVFRI
jgi:hypothetical protein